jgi:GNAT superfamily N-acetyltransferase
MSLVLCAPLALAATHHLDDFSCGQPSLDEWLKRRALSNQMSGASRTFVVTDQLGHVKGYYAMAAGAVSHQAATSGVRRNMPDPVPVMVLARLAVDQRAQGFKLGAALLQDAVHRAVAQRRGASVACPRAGRPRKAVLRALRLSSVATTPDDLDASLELNAGHAHWQDAPALTHTHLEASVHGSQVNDRLILRSAVNSNSA